jgi:hypothetical protein
MPVILLRPISSGLADTDFKNTRAKKRIRMPGYTVETSSIGAGVDTHVWQHGVPNLIVGTNISIIVARVASYRVRIPSVLEDLASIIRALKGAKANCLSAIRST